MASKQMGEDFFDSEKVQNKWNRYFNILDGFYGMQVDHCGQGCCS
jgi:hypothetical protein